MGGRREGRGGAWGRGARWRERVIRPIPMITLAPITVMIDRTTTALLDGLHDPGNQLVWREFDERYRPILIGFGRRMGLGEADAADVAQETLLRFVQSYREGKYDRTRGRLRSWIVGIARNCMHDLHRRDARRRVSRGLSAIATIPSEEELGSAWDAACERVVLQRGLEELRTTTRTDERTIQTFERLILDRRTPSDVADEMKISLNDVYLAKHRCLKRLKDIVERLEQTYELQA